MNFLNLMLDAKNGEFNMNREDEIIAGTLVCTDGEVIGKLEESKANLKSECASRCFARLNQKSMVK